MSLVELVISKVCQLRRSVLAWRAQVVFGGQASLSLTLKNGWAGGARRAIFVAPATEVITMAEAAVPLLLATTGSGVAAVLETMLVNQVALAGLVMVTVKLVLDFAAKVLGRRQVITPWLLVPPPEALTKPAPAGIK